MSSSQRPRRVGVMGGTFDPIHHGHLVAASEAQSRLRLDEVVFVPTGCPSHRQAPGATAEHRYLMTVIATASNPRFTVSRVDVERDKPTFTIDTLRDLRAERATDEFFFITGADAVAHIMSWKDSDELWDLAHFVAVTRPGHALTNPGVPDDRVTFLEVPALAISSTDCRRRINENLPLWYLVPDGIVQHINKYRLYSAAAPAPPATQTMSDGGSALTTVATPPTTTEQQ